MRRVQSQITIENVVRVRLQNRVSHAGMIGTTQMLTPSLIRESTHTAEDVKAKGGDELVTDQFKNRQSKLYSALKPREHAS